MNPAPSDGQMPGSATPFVQMGLPLDALTGLDRRFVEMQAAGLRDLIATTDDSNEFFATTVDFSNEMEIENLAALTGASIEGMHFVVSFVPLFSFLVVSGH